jgi:hypothetical protein
MATKFVDTTMTTDEDKTTRILLDLGAHFSERLTQVITDYGDRLEEVGLCAQRVDAKITSALILVAASAVARISSVPPQEAGAVFAAAINDWRSKSEHPAHLDKIVTKIVKHRKKQ